MLHRNPTDTEIAKLLKNARVFALVGASPKKERPSFSVMTFLLSKGYKVIPINPTLPQGEILGQRVCSHLSEVSAPVDIVDFFRSPETVLEDVREALKEKERLGFMCVWMQLGVVNEKAAEEAQRSKLQVIMDRCPKIEFMRLLEHSEHSNIP